MSARFILDGDRLAADVVDDFIAAEKTLVGLIAWQEHSDPQKRVAHYVVAIDGIPTQSNLHFSAWPNMPELKFNICLTWPPCIWRLDYDLPSEGHTNPLSEFSEFDGVVYGPHYHSWADNRVDATANALPKEIIRARDLGANVQGFDNALRWFCGETNITIATGQIINLPPRETMF